MPMTLPPISRRRFLAGALAAGAGAWTQGVFAAERAVDRHRFALLADTHVSGDRDEVVRGANMAANLERVGRELLALEAPPAAVLIDGDCAYLDGKRGDYAVLADLVRPLRAAGLPVHLALGNHDHRGHFREALLPEDGEAGPLEDRHLTVIETPRANWFVLDSLDVTNRTPGVLGREQLAWLGKALDRRADRPALVMVHHNPDERPMPSGLTDTRPLFEALVPRRHVKALFFGHTHNWHVTERDGLHLVNLPPTAYVFGAGRPNGWVDLRLADGGAILELRCLDPEHPQHGETVELAWRG